LDLEDHLVAVVLGSALAHPVSPLIDAIMDKIKKAGSETGLFYWM